MLVLNKAKKQALQQPFTIVSITVSKTESVAGSCAGLSLHIGRAMKKAVHIFLCQPEWKNVHNYENPPTLCTFTSECENRF